MNKQQRLRNKQYILDRLGKDELIEQIIGAKKIYYALRDKYKRKYGETLYYERQYFEKRKSLISNS